MIDLSNLVRADLCEDNCKDLKIFMQAKFLCSKIFICKQS